jgi:putative flippase GtrA
MKKFLRDNFRDLRLIIRYGISGVAAIFANIATLYAATHFFGIWYIWSAFIAFVVSIAVGFTLQKYWTFRNASSGRTHKEIANYFLIAVIGNLLGIAFLYIFTAIFGIWYLYSQVIGLGIVALLSFIANKNLTFQNNKNTP